MFKKSLIVLVLLNFVVVVAFVLSYSKNRSFVPLYIGLLPFVLCNFIYVREFVAPKSSAEAKAETDQPIKKLNILPLLTMPFFFCISLSTLIKFDSSLGWSPVVSLGFSLLLCVVIIAGYAGLKTALKCTRS